MKIDKLFLWSLLTGLLLVSSPLYADDCSDATNWVRGTWPEVTNQSSGIITTNTISLKMYDIPTPDSRVSSVDIKINGTKVGEVDVDLHGYALFTITPHEYPALASIKHGQKVSITLAYHYYIRHDLWPNTCYSVNDTRTTELIYKDPTITDADFTLTPTTSICDRTTTVTLSNSSKVYVDGNTSYTWNVAGPFTWEYTNASRREIIIRPTASYNATTNKTLTVSVTIGISIFTYSRSLTLAPVFSAPKGTITLASALSGCNSIRMVPAIVGVNTTLNPLKLVVEAGGCADDVSSNPPSGTCALMYTKDPVTNVIEVFENSDFLQTLPPEVKDKPRTYKLYLYSEDQGCKLIEARTTLTFYNSTTTWGAGRLFNSSNIGNVASNIAILPLDPNKSTDDELYFINNSTKKLNRYRFDVVTNVWKIQELPTPAVPVLNTDSFKKNVAVVKGADGFYYVYYITFPTKSIQWQKLNPTTGQATGSGIISGSFDYISAQVVTTQRYLIAYRASVTPATATVYKNETGYSTFYPEGTSYNLCWLPSITIGEFTGKIVESSGNKLQVRDITTNPSTLHGIVSLPGGAKKIETALASSNYHIYVLTSTNAIQYITVDASTNQFTTTSTTTITQRTNTVAFDFAVNQLSGTIYVGANLTSGKVLYTLWTDNIETLNYNASTQSTVIPGNAGLGFYTYLHPHLYYVAQETSSTGNQPRALYNTWFSEGCTPPNARLAATEATKETESKAEMIREKAGLILSCVPNPVTDQGQIRFALPKDTDVQMEMFTLTGSRVSVLTKKAFTQGEHTLELPVTLANGIYMIRLTTPTESKFVRVVIQR